MRSINLFAIVLLVLILASCKKELERDAALINQDKTGIAGLNLANAGIDTLTVKINGTVWTGNKLEGAIAVESDQLVINAGDLDLPIELDLSLPSDVQPGTYDMEAFGAFMGMYSTNEGSPFVSESGRITVLERDDAAKRIRGTFEFKAKDFSGESANDLTEGYFSLTYN